MHKGTFNNNVDRILSFFDPLPPHLVHVGIECPLRYDKGPFNNLRGQDEEEGEGGQKMSVFVHSQGIKTVHLVVE